MNSSSILYGKSNDENYTPDYGVFPILKHIPEDWTVWCPFDSKDSEFVKQISLRNKVLFSHIDNGQDFFEYEPSEKWDCIISNPPFKNKKQFFLRALSFGKPFALMMTNAWLNDSAPVKIFKEHGRQLQLLMFDSVGRYPQVFESMHKRQAAYRFLCLLQIHGLLI